MHDSFKQLLKQEHLIKSYFRKPGGRKHLENITLILINTLPCSFDEKDQLYLNFVGMLDNMQQRIRQQEGEEILEAVFAR